MGRWLYGWHYGHMCHRSGETTARTNSTRDKPAKWRKNRPQPAFVRQDLPSAHLSIRVWYICHTCIRHLLIISDTTHWNSAAAWSILLRILLCIELWPRKCCSAADLTRSSATAETARDTDDADYKFTPPNNIQIHPILRQMIYRRTPSSSNHARTQRRPSALHLLI